MQYNLDITESRSFYTFAINKNGTLFSYYKNSGHHLFNSQLHVTWCTCRGNLHDDAATVAATAAKTSKAVIKSTFPQLGLKRPMA